MSFMISSVSHTQKHVFITKYIINGCVHDCIKKDTSLIEILPNL